MHGAAWCWLAGQLVWELVDQVAGFVLFIHGLCGCRGNNLNMHNVPVADLFQTDNSVDASK